MKIIKLEYYNTDYFKNKTKILGPKIFYSACLTQDRPMVCSLVAYIVPRVWSVVNPYCKSQNKY